MLISKAFFLMGLVFALLLSALAVIESKHHSRLLFIDIQAKEKTLDDYEVAWGQLQIELTMLTDENRIEGIAKNQLKLKMPVRKQIIYLKL